MAPNWIGVVLCALAVLLLNQVEPNYFTQDDNFAQFFPAIAAGAESLLGSGVFPTWNPHQWMGAPLASVGTYALTYPGTYLSYFVATRLLADPMRTLDLFFLLHAIPGFLILSRELRRMGSRPWIAATGALAFILCGYHLVAGRSWFYMVPFMLWLPAVFSRLRPPEGGRVNRRDVWLTGAALGLSFHAGNAQMWFYLVAFWLLGRFLLILTCEQGRGRMAQITALELAIGLAIALPLLVPQMQFLIGSYRPDGYGNGILRGIAGLLIPYPLLDAPHPNRGQIDGFGLIYYAGGVYTLLGLLAWGSGALQLRREPRRTLAATGWVVVLALFAFLLALGPDGGLWNVLLKLPFHKKFTRPIKLLPFLHYFLIILGTGLASRWVARGLRPQPARGRSRDRGPAGLTPPAFLGERSLFPIRGPKLSATRARA